MDILLKADGDLFVSPDGDIMIGNSVAQKVRIKLLWFAGEWRWDTDEGLPYFEELLVKNPDTDYFESIIRQTICEIDEITEVKNVEVTFDKHTRNAVIRYTALTDYETLNEEVVIAGKLRSNG